MTSLTMTSEIENEKYVYFIAYELNPESDINGNYIITEEDKEYIHKIPHKYIIESKLNFGFFDGISFLNKSECDDSMIELMENDVLNDDTNTINFIIPVMNNEIIPLIIEFITLFYHIPFDEVHKPIIGDTLEENLPIEWVKFVRPYAFNVVLNNEDITKSKYNDKMHKFFKASEFLCCEKMQELYGCFMGCLEGLSNKSLSELRVIFQDFENMEDDDNFDEEEELQKIQDSLKQSNDINKDDEDSDDEDSDDEDSDDE
jgi:hypothetical protein